MWSIWNRRKKNNCRPTIGGVAIKSQVCRRAAWLLSVGNGGLMKKTVVLKGSGLTIGQFNAIVRDNLKVEIDQKTYQQLVEARKLVFDLAEEGVPIYGFTVGVGWNKDKKVFARYFDQYNKNLIYAHCVASGEPMDELSVRAALLARLATFLTAKTGAQPELIDMYRQFLNRAIHPVIPWDGSVGQADIGTLSHIGLAMIGEGDVFYKGKRVSAASALKAEGLSPIVLGPKDGLAIVSSNAQAAGVACLLIWQAEQLLKKANVIYALSLEGLNGNVTPLNARVNAHKKLKGQIKCAGELRKILKGSYLNQREITRSLQDPLSFRDVVAVHGAVYDALGYAKKQFENHLNSTEDNPCLLLEERKIISCANFEATNLALALEMISLALAHLSKMSTYRTLRLASPSFTGLSRFLSPNEGDVQAYQTIQKNFTAHDAAIRHLANPSTLDFAPVAGDIEDHANNTVQIDQRIAKILEHLNVIFAIELLHAAQAVDLRDGVALGAKTRKLYAALRKKVPFLDRDRPLTFDIEKACQVVADDSWL